MRPFYLNRTTRVWLISSIFVLLVNLIVFIFKKHFDTMIVFWVVLLTPVAWLGLYFLCRLVVKRN
jgi:uncharacterized membrane protein (DUF106 family)